MMSDFTLFNDNGYGSGEYQDNPSQRRETDIVNLALTPLPPPIFTGMKLQEDISLGTLVLNKIDSNNVIWVCTDIEGWWTLPDPEVPDITRGWFDGSYDASGRWAARNITLNGTIFPPAPEYLPTARNTLIEALNLVRTGAWLKTNENPTRAAYVRLSGRPNIETVAARGKTEFSVGLRAADPILYSWNDADPDGYDSVTIPCENSSTSETGIDTIENVGNFAVSLFLEVTGPVVGPATIYNADTDELLTIVEPLRDSETRTVTFKELTDNVATLTVSASHTIVAGDYITVTGVDSTFNTASALVTDVPTSTKISYVVTANNVTLTAASGAVNRDADVLEIDTYSREVALNGESIGARVKVDTLTDWVTLQPGENEIRFTDEGDATSDATLIVYYRSGWIG